MRSANTAIFDHSSRQIGVSGRGLSTNQPNQLHHRNYDRGFFPPLFPRGSDLGRGRDAVSLCFDAEASTARARAASAPAAGAHAPAARERRADRTCPGV